jgi:hypothetical protein
MGNCHHRKYIPLLIDLVLNHRIDPAKILTQIKPMSDAIEAFKAFDRRDEGWIKVELHPQMQLGVGSEEQIKSGRLEQTIEASASNGDMLTTMVPKRS